MDKKLRNLIIIVTFVVLLVIVGYIFLNCKSRENFTIENNLGSVDTNTAPGHTILGKGENISGMIGFKRTSTNDEEGVIELSPVDTLTFRSQFTPNVNNNYNYINTSLIPGRQEGVPIVNFEIFNLMTDFFDFCWNSETHSWKKEFIIGFIKGFYYDPNKEIILLTYDYCKEILMKMNIFYTNEKDYLNDILMLCKLLCRSMGYVNVYKSASAILNKDYPNYQFFILCKYYHNINPLCTNTYPCVKDSCYSQQSESKLAMKELSNMDSANTRYNEMLNRNRHKFEEQGLAIPDVNINIPNKLPLGIPFLLGQDEIVDNMWENSMYNNIIKYDNGGLYIISISQNSFENGIFKNVKGNLIDGNYCGSSYDLTSNYMMEFLKSTSVNKNGTQTTSNNQSENNNNWGFSINSDRNWGFKGFGWGPGATDYPRNTSRGTTTGNGNVSVTTTNNGENNWGWNWTGSKWTTNISIDRSDTISFSYYVDITKSTSPPSLDKIREKSVTGNPLCLRDGKIKIGTSHSNYNNITSIEIDTFGVFVRTMGNPSGKDYIYRLEDYGFSNEDLIGNPCWLCHSSNCTGKLGVGNSSIENILGINGCNNQFVINNSGSIRFYFTLFGTFTVEINIKRNFSSDSSEQHVENRIKGFDKYFTKNFTQYNIKRMKGIYLNNGNYSGSPLTAMFGIFSLLTLRSCNLNNNSDSIDVNPVSIFSEEDESNMYLYFNPVTGNTLQNVNVDDWEKKSIGIASKNCKYWFTRNNIFKNDEIDNSNFGDFINNGLLKTNIELGGRVNNRLNTSEKLDTVEDALNECSNREDCHAVSCNNSDIINPQDSKCELWAKGGIENNFAERGIFNTPGNYDTYNKICPNINTQDFVDAGFQTMYNNNYNPQFSQTGLIVNYNNSLDLTVNKTVDNIKEFVEITDDIIIEHVNNNYNAYTNTDTINNSCSFYQVEDVSTLIDNDNRNGTNSAKTKIVSMIIEKKDQIKIPFAYQTNRTIFNDKLMKEICRLIVQTNLTDASKARSRGFAEENVVASNNSQDSARASMNFTTSSQETFSNLNDINSKNNTDHSKKIKMAHDKIIKNCIYNIKDNNEIYGQDNVITKFNDIHTVILFILVVIITVVFINIIKKGKK